MPEIHSFKEIYNELLNMNKVKTLKDFADKSGNSYTYMSELNNNKKPLNPEFVNNINNKFSTDFVFVKPDELAAAEPQELYQPVKSKDPYLDIIHNLVESNQILARSVESMATSIQKITDMKVREHKYA